MQENLFAALDQYEAEMIRLRRDFHRHPELSFQEVRTPAKIIAFYEALGIPYREQVGGSGIVATLKGTQGEKRLLSGRILTRYRSRKKPIFRSVQSAPVSCMPVDMTAIRRSSSDSPLPSSRCKRNSKGPSSSFINMAKKSFREVRFK